MKASDYIVSFLESKGSTTIFSLSGGMISHLEDSIFLNKNTQLISVKHEQAGAFAAEGYTRVSGVTGVAMGTSGPGATNMVTGIASAYFDSIPVLYITGQVRTDELTPDDAGVRQTGFQETKIIPIVTPITKYAKHIPDIGALRYELEKAYFLMHHGRKGPAVLDIPMNIQRVEIDPESLPSFFSSEEYRELSVGVEHDFDVQSVIHDLQKAKRPLILVGGGIQIAQSTGLLDTFLRTSHIPVVASLMGIDAVSHEYPGYVGMIGSYGVRHANILVSHADYILVLGSRLDLRQTGAMKSEFAKKAKIVHVDIDKSELGYNVQHTHVKIHADVVSFLEKINASKSEYPLYIEWYREIKALKKLLPVYSSELLHECIHPNYFFHRITEIMPAGTVYVNDVGQNQMWSSQSLRLKQGDRLLNSGGLGSMGFSIPAGLGSSFVPGVNHVVSFNGDGGFQMNIQELETISARQLQVSIFVLNNKSLGMIREFQDTYFEGRNIGTILGYSCPDLSMIAQAFRMPYFRIETPEDLETVLPLIREVLGPSIVEVMISRKAIVEPKMLYGNTMDKQSPPLPPEIEEQIQNIFS